MKAKSLIFAVFDMIVKILLVAVAVMLITKGAMTAYDYGYRIFDEKPMALGQGTEMTVVIPPGMSSEEMGVLLQSKGLIRDAKLFRLQYMFSEYKDDIKPGTFKLNTAMTVEQMMEAMTHDQVPEEEED